MAFTHGIYVKENQTRLTTPVTADSAVQVVIGTAPVNMTTDDKKLEPKIAYNFDEAIEKIGYSNNLEKFTLMQSVISSFINNNISPVIFINVLDPSKHKKIVTSEKLNVIEEVAFLENEGVLIDTVILKQSEKTLIADTDYSICFDKYGKTKITLFNKKDEKISATYTHLDSSMVETKDIVEGIKKVKEIYPRFNIVPGIVIAPEYSHYPEVYNALISVTHNLNSVFQCVTLIDINCEKYDEANSIKKINSFIDKNAICLFPKYCLVGGDKICFSAILASHIGKVDYENDSVPYVSPSNRNINISGVCTPNKKEILLDIEQANLLNSQGICTALNMNGWRFWGNRTATYPASSDVKDVFISVKRMFNWWSNTFILTYFQKVDNPMNKRLIESVIDSENIRANGFKARQQIADARIEFLPSENPQTDLMDGKIRFRQLFTPFTPAETIINVLEFDPRALQNSLF